MTSKAELLPFSAGGTTNVSKCQAVGALALLSGLLATHTISPACPFGQRFDWCKHKNKPMQEHVRYKNPVTVQKKKCAVISSGEAVFSLCVQLCTHI